MASFFILLHSLYFFCWLLSWYRKNCIPIESHGHSRLEKENLSKDKRIIPVQQIPRNIASNSNQKALLTKQGQQQAKQKPHAMHEEHQGPKPIVDIGSWGQRKGKHDCSTKWYKVIFVTWLTPVYWFFLFSNRAKSSPNNENRSRSIWI